MKIWVPEVVLVVRDQGSGKIVTIGGTTRPTSCGAWLTW